MRRFGVVQSTAGALLLVTAIYAVTAACVEDLTAPCAQDRNSLEARGLLDGNWAAATINGQPAAGWPIPFPSLDRLESGAIEFQTTSVTGDCNNPKWSSGHAVAIYTLRKPDNSLKPKRFLGRFVYNHTEHRLELSAAGYEVNGSVSSHTITMPAAHDLFGTATLVLQLAYRP